MAVRKKLSEAVISSVIQDKIRDDLSGKLETVREKSGNFTKLPGKLKFLAFRTYNIRTLHLRSFGILPT